VQLPDRRVVLKPGSAVESAAERSLPQAEHLTVNRDGRPRIDRAARCPDDRRTGRALVQTPDRPRYGTPIAQRARRARDWRAAHRSGRWATACSRAASLTPSVVRTLCCSTRPSPVVSIFAAAQRRRRLRSLSSRRSARTCRRHLGGRDGDLELRLRSIRGGGRHTHAPAMSPQGSRSISFRFQTPRT
jgi:hypothetical protein